MRENGKYDHKYILSELGLWYLADKEYVITVRIAETGQAVSIKMKGWQNHNDIIDYLKNNGFLNQKKCYKFVDWPHSAGGVSHLDMAYICELKEREFTLIEYEKLDNMVCLYGCPNAKTIGSSILRPVSEVFSYE